MTMMRMERVASVDNEVRRINSRSLRGLRVAIEQFVHKSATVLYASIYHQILSQSKVGESQEAIALIRFVAV